jgi:hypothetical protein
MRRLGRDILVLTTMVLAIGCFSGQAMAQQELNYEQYRALSWAADRLDHLAAFEPIHGEAGMFTALGERFGTVIIIKHTGQGAERVWKSNQLSGIPDEVLTADLVGDGLDDAIICRTNAGKVYVWSMDNYALLWESLPSEYQTITCFTTMNMDEDEANEIVLLADKKIVYIDGSTFNKEWTSLNPFEATMIRCGDVDGDGRVEIVLNSGQVIDSVSGSIEWEEKTFFQNIELLDIDGDGMPEVLTENGLSGPLKVFDMDYGNEVRFQ